MPAPDSIPPKDKKKDDDRRERSTRSRRQRSQSADRRRTEQEGERPTPRTGPMKSADDWPRSEASESISREVRKLDLGISPEQFGQDEPQQNHSIPISDPEHFSERGRCPIVCQRLQGKAAQTNT